MKSPINHHSIWPHGLVRTINFTALALVLFTATSLMAKGREADLPSPQCDSLNVSASNRISSHVDAKGVQIYRWNGTSGAFVGPEATLYADPCYNGEIGTHYAGPTWKRRTAAKSWPPASPPAFRPAVPFRGCGWMRLPVRPQGRFGRITHVLRVNTVGGTAPATAGAFVGDEARVPYTTEYYFYRAVGNH